MKIEISEIQIVPIRPHNGLVGFASCVINNQFFVGNIAIYSSPNSPIGFRLVFPNKRLDSGYFVACFHPINKAAEEIVSEAIINKFHQLMDNFHNFQS